MQRTKIGCSLVSNQMHSESFLVPSSLHLLSLFCHRQQFFVKDIIHVYCGLVSSTVSKFWSIFVFVVQLSLRSSILRVLITALLFCQQKCLEKLSVCVQIISLEFGYIWSKWWDVRFWGKPMKIVRVSANTLSFDFSYMCDEIKKEGKCDIK